MWFEGVDAVIILFPFQLFISLQNLPKMFLPSFFGLFFFSPSNHFFPTIVLSSLFFFSSYCIVVLLKITNETKRKPQWNLVIEPIQANARKTTRRHTHRKKTCSNCLRIEIHCIHCIYHPVFTHHRLSEYTRNDLKPAQNRFLSKVGNAAFIAFNAV